MGEPELTNLVPDDVRWKVRIITRSDYPKLGIESLEVWHSAVIQHGKIKRVIEYYPAESSSALLEAMERLRQKGAGGFTAPRAMIRYEAIGVDYVATGDLGRQSELPRKPTLLAARYL